MLALHLGLSLWVIGALLLACTLAFFELAFGMKILTGRETLVYYHHEIAALLHAALLLWILRQPMLSYLDVTALAIGCFLVFGRTGCLLVGCCHGRPAETGVHYHAEHADAGFPALLVDVALIPVQAIEVAWVALTVLAGVAWVVLGSRPGEAFAWYVAVYAAGRFGLEYLRGDPDRRHWWGSSEAQWISLLSVGFLVIEEAAGRVPFHEWHGALVLLLIGLMIGNAIRRKRDGGLMAPRHVRILARLAEPAHDGPGVRVLGTSQGIRISRGDLRRRSERAIHYTVSNAKVPLTPESAAVLARVILRLRHPAEQSSIVQGQAGVFHVLVGSHQAFLPREERVESVAR
jgi:hypothetical protein